MSGRSIVATILGILVLLGGVVAGVLLVRERQEIREKAAVPGGQARVSLFPTTSSLDVGTPLPVTVYFNTSNVAISSVRILLRYPFSGSSPEVVATDLEINPVLANSGQWECPTRSITQEGGNVEIEVGCTIQAALGYKNNTDTQLATFTLTVERIPETNPFVMTFDNSQSIITQLSNGQDILSIADSQTSSGTYTVTTGGTEPSVSPTTQPTTQPTAQPTVKPTTAPTSAPTTTVRPTSTVKPTATPTSSVNLPDAGFELPTLLGLGLGVIFILSAALLTL